MSMFGAIDASASGLTAERLRMDVISNNIANANTTRTVEGGPYKRKIVTFEERDNQGINSFSQILSKKMKTGSGVRATGIIEDGAPGKLVYDPNHPDANKEGYVLTTTSEGIQINGQTENGVFYGCQTLRKSIQ